MVLACGPLETDVGLGERIRLRREERQWSVAALARAAGVSRNYVAELERGQSTHPSAPVLQRLADALGTSVADLLDEGTISTVVDIPEALLRLAEEEALSEEDVRTLAGLRWRGERPATLSDFRFVYEAIRRAVPPRGG